MKRYFYEILLYLLTRGRVASSGYLVREYAYFRGDVSEVMWTIITDSTCNFDYVNIYKDMIC